MYEYFQKYSILILVLIAIGVFTGAIVNFLSGYVRNINQAYDWSNLLWLIVAIIINVIAALTVVADMIKHKIKAFPVVLLTLVSFLPGVILFLFLLNHKISSHEE